MVCATNRNMSADGQQVLQTFFSPSKDRFPPTPPAKPPTTPVKPRKQPAAKARTSSIAITIPDSDHDSVHTPSTVSPVHSPVAASESLPIVPPRPFSCIDPAHLHRLNKRQLLALC